MSSNVISIDGPSGSGKTSIGKMLSGRLNADFLSSGLIYRMITNQYFRNIARWQIQTIQRLFELANTQNTQILNYGG